MKTELQRILTESYKAGMIAYLENHPEAFEEAVLLALSDQKEYAWRAAWLLWSCMEENDEQITGFVQQMIDILPYKEEAIQRELLIILQKMNLEESTEGKLFDRSILIWQDTSKKPSVRFNAFKILVKTAKKHPGLTSELLLLTQNEYLVNLSANAQKSILAMLEELR